LDRLQRKASRIKRNSAIVLTTEVVVQRIKDGRGFGNVLDYFGATRSGKRHTSGAHRSTARDSTIVDGRDAEGRGQRSVLVDCK
jgi:hypothetical protein